MAQYRSDWLSTVGTICLSTMSMPENEWLTATGWGGTDDLGTQSIDLKVVLHVYAKYFY